jgi:hypothetical protein
MIRVMFIGGRLHRQFSEVGENLQGRPASGYYVNPIPLPPELTPPNPLDWTEIKPIRTEHYRLETIVLSQRFKMRAFVYVLYGIDEQNLWLVYLKEPGIMEQLKEIAR